MLHVDFFLHNARLVKANSHETNLVLISIYFFRGTILVFVPSRSDTNCRRWNGLPNHTRNETASTILLSPHANAPMFQLTFLLCTRQGTCNSSSWQARQFQSLNTDFKCFTTALVKLGSMIYIDKFRKFTLFTVIHNRDLCQKTHLCRVFALCDSAPVLVECGFFSVAH